MKNLKIYITLLASLFVAISCLEDEKVENKEYGLLKKDLETRKIIEIPSNAKHTFAKAYLSEGKQKIVVGEINLAAKDPASEDVVVKLKKVSADKIISMVRKYYSDIYTEDVPDSDIQLFDNSDVNLPETVVIPAGKRSAPLEIEINTDLLDAGSKFFALNVESVNQDGYIVSGNYNNLLLDLKLKSIYEGKYTYEVSSNLGGNPGEVFLGTVSPNKVKFNLINKYSNEVFYIIDSKTNKVTVEAPSLDPIVTTSGVYDPKTKSFHVVWNARGGRFTFDETFTMK